MLEGTVVADAATILDLGGGSKTPTFSVVVRGSQVAGTLVPIRVTEDCVLLRVQCQQSVISFSRTATSIAAVPTGVSRTVIVCGGGNVVGPWEGREAFKAGDIIYMDSLGGLGENDFIQFTFERATPT